jgi:hypothetical protein
VKLRLSFLLAALLALLARPVPVWACSCAQPASPAQAFGQAQAVFVGTVTGIRDVQPPPWLAGVLQRLPGYEYPGSPVQVSFQVNTAWKGLAVDGVTVHIGHGDADCGFVFAPGAQYLVYTYEQDGQHHTNICQRTAEVRFATADLAYLQPLTPLALALAAVAARLPVLAAAGLAALALAALGGLAWAGARRSRAR